MAIEFASANHLDLATTPKPPAFVMSATGARIFRRRRRSVTGKAPVRHGRREPVRTRRRRPPCARTVFSVSDVVQTWSSASSTILARRSLISSSVQIIAGEILHPFEIADRHAAGVADDVGHDDDPARGEHIVGLRQGRAVGAFQHEAGLDAFGARRRQLSFQRRGNKHVAVDIPERLAIDGFAAGKARGAAPVPAMCQKLGDRQALGARRRRANPARRRPAPRRRRKVRPRSSRRCRSPGWRCERLRASCSAAASRRNP